MITIVGLAALGLGYAIGVFQGGIHVNIGKPATSKPADESDVKYNKVIAPPPEIEQYLTQSNGHIR